VLRKRQKSQSVVEFGIIAILFTLIMFAIADFGLLLNDWLSVSTGARQLARDAAVGLYTCSVGDPCPKGYKPELLNEAGLLPIPGVTADPYFGGSYCCSFGSPGSALQVRVVYWNECTPPTPFDPKVCPNVDPKTLDSRYDSDGVQGSCDWWDPNKPHVPPYCPHPAAPAPANSCGGPALCPGDTVTVTLTAAGAQVITPLVRPFFKNSTTCPLTTAYCYVPVSSTVTMRFEGGTAP